MWYLLEPIDNIARYRVVSVHRKYLVASEKLNNLPNKYLCFIMGTPPFKAKKGDILVSRYERSTWVIKKE